jgi:hypothetical protein
MPGNLSRKIANSAYWIEDRLEQLKPQTFSTTSPPHVSHSPQFLAPDSRRSSSSISHLSNSPINPYDSTNPEQITSISSVKSKFQQGTSSDNSAISLNSPFTSSKWPNALHPKKETQSIRPRPTHRENTFEEPEYSLSDPQEIDSSAFSSAIPTNPLNNGGWGRGVGSNESTKVSGWNSSKASSKWKKGNPASKENGIETSTLRK